MGAHQKRTGKLCKVDGKYRRTIGKFVNGNGKLVPKKFYLGHDKDHAEVANLRLEKLWDRVVKKHAEDRESVYQWLATLQATRTQVSIRDDGAYEYPSFDLIDQAVPPEPQWDKFSLAVADAIRKNEPLPITADDGDKPEEYTQFYQQAREAYPDVELQPDGDEAMSLLQKGRQSYAMLADQSSQRYHEYVKLANIEITEPIEASLYRALDDYAVYLEKTKKGETAKVHAGNVRRLKRSTADMPLNRLDYNALESIKHYWADRPPAKQTGKPIALDTVRLQMEMLRGFVRWLHRNSEYNWRKPEDADEAMRLNVSGLQTPEEISGLKNGVQVFSVEQLASLYRHATDHEAVYLLLGLNMGAAQAECISLRWTEIDLSGKPATIKRVRRKSKVYGEWSLWPETIAGFKWLADLQRERKQTDSELVLWTEKGNAYTRQRIANAWNGLRKRIKKAEPEFEGLSFKHLRKTAGQLVRDASDGETAGVFLAHGHPVSTDLLSDRYSNRPFQKVFQALDQVHEVLEPMFAERSKRFDTE